MEAGVAGFGAARLDPSIGGECSFRNLCATGVSHIVVPARLRFGPAAHTFCGMTPHRPSVRLVAACFAAAWLPSAGVAQKPAAPPPGFDAYVATVLKTFTVPGIAVAIVKDGKVVLARGYGVRKLGDPTPVDARTLFGIASNTKVFTATALAILVEEGKVEWDAPVIRYLPWFAMHDPYVTRELTVRDLLVHRSGLGLGAGDLLWWPPSTYTGRRSPSVSATSRRPRQLPQRVRLRQRAVPRRGRGDRDGDAGRPGRSSCGRASSRGSG